MPYLTYGEFGDSTIDEETFDELLAKASALLDHITNNFYVKNNIAADTEWRAKKFKQALKSQIEYFVEVGSATFEGINKEPQSFSAGRTSVTNTSRYSIKGSNKSRTLIAEEVYIHLAGTGLLYSGVGVL